MSLSPKTPINQKRKMLSNIENMGTPMFVPPSPMLQSLGYGTGVHVYRIERSPLGGSARSPWAIKRVRKNADNLNDSLEALFGKRLNEEASILRKLDHPNIVGYRGVKNIADGRQALVMEDCHDCLGNILEQREEESLGPLPSADIKRVCSDIFNALDYLHTKAKILHADIKSANILIKDNFKICKLCDFGVSLPLDNEGFVDFKAHPNSRYVGTDLYTAPEALSDDDFPIISYKADIFSFGLVIYECIALIPPHTWSLAIDDEKSETSVVDLTEEKEQQEEEVLPEEDNLALLFGTRPPLPEADSLTSDYNILVEIFFVCTHSDPENRPAACYLHKLLNESCNNKDEEKAVK